MIQAQSQKHVILYVDDDENNLKLFFEYMKVHYEVLTAITTTEAYDLLKRNPVKVLIADQRMPDETGLEFIERITPEFPDLIKIIFTAYTDHDVALKAINQGGIYRYILKPWNTQEMKQVLKNAVREYDLRFENRNLIEQLACKNLVLEKAYHQIRENEKKFTGIFQASSDGMLLLKGHQILEANKAFLEIIGLKIHDYTPEIFGSFLEKSMHYVFSSDINDENSFEFYDSNQTRKYLELRRQIFHLSGEELLLVIVRDVTERKLMDQKIMETIFRTQEESQNHYAQELHDGLGPVLSTVKMYTEWLCNDKNMINRELIRDKAILAIDEAITLTKEIANKLSPHILKRFGLVNAIKNYSELLSDHKIKFNIQSRISVKLSSDLEIMLYRVLIECISNSIKHANPGNITIHFDQKGQNVIIIYNDDGKGFDVNQTISTTSGMGLFNIQNRIKMAGGNINIQSEIGKGTSIYILLTI